MISAYIEDLLHLEEVVDSFGVKLELKLVSDLLEAVFPVHLYESVFVLFSYFK